MSRSEAWQGLCIVIIFGCFGLLAVELIFGHEEAPDPCFVVSDGHQSVSYDAQAMKMRVVVFDPRNRVVVQIYNPSPKTQYLEVYSQQTDLTTKITKYGVLLCEKYTITVRAKDGTKLAQTKLRIIRDNSI